MTSSNNDRLVPILYLVRGLPGAGKSTYANTLGCIVIAPSDQMSHRGGEYHWIRDNYMISKMHFREVVRRLMSLQIDIAITEIMPEKPFIDFWVNEAKDYRYKVIIKTLLIDPETAITRNVHGADHKSITEINEQFDYSIGDQVLDFSSI
jgi:predicted ABC-type ATPase